MTIRTALLGSLLAMMLVAETAGAKGMTVQLTLTGPGLDAPLHLASDAVIDANVWTGNFADWEAGAIDPVPEDMPIYRVHFWVRFAPGDVQMKYVLGYRWDTAANRAIICLPGPRSIWHRINVFSISREGQDGKCFYAEERWGQAIKAALP